MDLPRISMPVKQNVDSNKGAARQTHSPGWVLMIKIGQVQEDGVIDGV